MQFCQIQSEQGRHIPTFFSAWYLVCCILEFILDKSKLPTTISSKYFQLLIFKRISRIHRTVSYSIWTEKEFKGWNFLQNLKNFMLVKHHNHQNIDTFTCTKKKCVVQLNSTPKNVYKTQDWSQKYCEHAYGHWINPLFVRPKTHLSLDN